jgi:hypothetical protein
MRRLPPPHEPETKSTWSLVAPKAMGLAIGLLLGYLLLPGPSSEPAAATRLSAAEILR